MNISKYVDFIDNIDIYNIHDLRNIEEENYNIIDEHIRKINELDNNDINLTNYPNGILVEEYVADEKKIEQDIEILSEKDVFEKELNIFRDQIENNDKKSNNKNVCENCGNGKTFVENYKTGEILCTECGSVFDIIYNDDNEALNISDSINGKEKNGRCGGTSSYYFPISSQGTIIKGLNDSRLNKKQKWILGSYKEKSLKIIFDKIDQICENLGILKIVSDDAKSYFNIFKECRHTEGVNLGKNIITRGNKFKGIIGSCIYRACENNGYPIDIKNIAEQLEISEKKITNGNNKFEMHIRNSTHGDFLYEGLDFSDKIINHIKTKYKYLNLTHEHFTDMARMTKNICILKLAVDRNSKSLAAGIIVLYCLYNSIKIDRKEVIEICNTSDVTINKIINSIYGFTQVVLSDELTQHIVNVYDIK